MDIFMEIVFKRGGTQCYVIQINLTYKFYLDNVVLSCMKHFLF